jgi:hypothetical protein
MILETSVGQAKVCDFWGAGQGVTTRNGRSIPRSYTRKECPRWERQQSCSFRRDNAAMRHTNRVIWPVAGDAKRVYAKYRVKLFSIISLNIKISGQLRFPG